MINPAATTQLKINITELKKTGRFYKVCLRLWPLTFQCSRWHQAGPGPRTPVVSAVQAVSGVTGLLPDAWTELQVRGHRGRRLTPQTALQQQTCPPVTFRRYWSHHTSANVSMFHATGASVNAPAVRGIKKRDSVWSVSFTKFWIITVFF